MPENRNTVSYSLRFFIIALAFLTALPIPFALLKIAHFGYGWTVSGVLGWLLSLIVIGALAICCRFRVEARAVSSRERWPFHRIIILIAYIGVIGLTVENFIFRIPSEYSVFSDLNLIFVGAKTSEDFSLSLFGKVALFLSGSALYVGAFSVVQRGLIWKLVMIAPALILVANVAVLGQRQIIMFLAILTAMALALRSNIRRRYVVITVVTAFFVGLIFLVGHARLAAVDPEILQMARLLLANTEDVVIDLDPQTHAILTYIYLYIGNSPESLSIFIREGQPSYVLFSHSSALFRRLLEVPMGIPSYEWELRFLMHDPFFAATGYFPRVWATGNLQLFAEGGWYYVAGWYLLLSLWFKRILDCARRGEDIYPRLVLFTSIVLFHQFVFPLTDQIMSLSIFWFFGLDWLQRRSVYFIDPGKRKIAELHLPTGV